MCGVRSIASWLLHLSHSERVHVMYHGTEWFLVCSAVCAVFIAVLARLALILPTHDPVELIGDPLWGRIQQANFLVRLS